MQLNSYVEFDPDGAQKANQVFLPVLESASKAQKLRTTLGVFDRSKFFFNLPSFIMESIEAVCPSASVVSYWKLICLPSRGAMRSLFVTIRRGNICSKTAQDNFYQ